MKEGWRIKKLGEVCEVVTRGITPKYVEEGGIQVINQKCIRDHEIDLEFARLHDSRYKTVNRQRLIKFGDVLVNSTGTGTLGRVAQVKSNYDVPITVDTHVTIVRPLENLFFVEYFGYALINIEEKIKNSGEGTSGQTELSKTKLQNEFYIPIPPLPEQQQIVALLDEAFAAIDQAKANIERNIRNARELFQSKLNEVFSGPAVSGAEDRGDGSASDESAAEGWVERKLGEVCEIVMGQSPSGASYNSEGIGIPLINGPVEFGARPFSETIKSKWTTEPTKLCQKGDLILCVRGSTTGRINIAGFDACIGRGVAAIRYVKNQEWLNFFMRANQKKIYDLGTGSTFPNVSSQILAKLEFPEASLKQQISLVEAMKSLDLYTSGILELYKKKIQLLDDLKKSLLQKAFSGELTVFNHDLLDSKIS
ncbi:MAG TPA: restriction endonuclease subunit S [Flavilitoribacter sp.]|nr:restriction endonuclease subunit S [Flavilitoribacter sp.]